MENKTLKQRILTFLHDQLEANKIPHIRKGMVEDFEQFVQALLAEQQTIRAADKMIAQKPEQEDFKSPLSLSPHDTEDDSETHS